MWVMQMEPMFVGLVGQVHAQIVILGRSGSLMMLGMMAVPRKVGVRESRGSQYVSCFVCLLDAVWRGDLLSKERAFCSAE